jgi:hypothetical protein
MKKQNAIALKILSAVFCACTLVNLYTSFASSLQVGAQVLPGAFTLTLTNFEDGINFPAVVFDEFEDTSTTWNTDIDSNFFTASDYDSITGFTVLARASKFEPDAAAEALGQEAISYTNLAVTAEDVTTNNADDSMELIYGSNGSVAFSSTIKDNDDDNRRWGYFEGSLAISSEKVLLVSTESAANKLNFALGGIKLTFPAGTIAGSYTGSLEIIAFPGQY